MTDTESDPAPGNIPVTVLTGFLGSGKTTVLNYLIQQPELRRTLVLINEFGEIGLDHDLVTQSAEDVVVEMSSGCLCCTIRGDLVKVLREAPARFARSGKPWFDRLVIETTGLADPAPILQTIMTNPQIARRYRLDGVVTAVDAVNGHDTLDVQEESVKQVAVADRLLITKSDLADPIALNRLQDRLRTLNPAAPQTPVKNGTVNPAEIFDIGLYNPATKSLDVQNWLKAEAYADKLNDHHGHQHGHDHQHHHDVNRHDANIKAVCLMIDEPINREYLDAWLETLSTFGGPDFLRTKGIINVEGTDQPVVIHGVQHVFHPAVHLNAWPSEDRRTRIVFITRGIDEKTLRETLSVLTLTKVKASNPTMLNGTKTVDGV